MAEPTALEQYMLELVNAERAKAGVQPLAFDNSINTSADNHTDWMLATDTFSHTGVNGTSAGQRMASAGYTGATAWGENIAWASTRAPEGLQDEVQLLHTNLMNSSGHRANILNASYREVGIGFATGEYQGWNAAFVTQNFGKQTNAPILTGVAFNDRDADGFYDPSEGLSGVTVTATDAYGRTYTTTSMSAGGYQLELTAGTYTVTFSGAANGSKQVTIADRNVKVDVTGTGAAAPEPDPAPTPPPAPTPVSGINGTSGNDSLVGTSGADTINGLDGNDSLDGRAGADIMTGGAGNDVYYVDNSGDKVVEIAGQGTDTVYSSISHTLASHVENLFLRNSSSINATGNDLANELRGNSGSNVLNGGAGNDLIAGGSGRDAFVFNTALSASGNVDTITDFNVIYDTIRLENAVFTKVGGTGTLSSGAFYRGAAAHDSSDRIIYDSATGALSYDADGNGAGAAVKFAQLAKGLALSNADFLVI